MKTIIIYATKHGCTAKAVKLLKSKMSQAITTVDLEKDGAPHLPSFDTVIVGGPIYVGKLPKKMSDYLQKNKEALKKKRLALFVCSGEQDPILADKQIAVAFPEELYKHAFLRENMGGELHWDKLDFITKLMLRAVKGIKQGYSRLSTAKIEMFAMKVL